MEYKSTLNLPKTNFSMKANLVEKEPLILKKWLEEDIYGKIRKSRSGKEKSVLHDGPPYANGHIHMGHVLNKILKDIVVKHWTMKGYDSPFIPGWDCHGLPVEHQLLKELKKSKHDIDQVSFRKKARDYALKFVELQKKEFERLGIFGDWKNSYLTLDPKYEASIARSFAKLVKEGYVYKDLKPVNWCTTCETALAEAEVEYENHSSPSIYFKFKIKDSKNFTDLKENTHFVVWTTTPWTLLGNVAIAIHPDLSYAVLKSGNEKWIILESLAKSVMDKIKKPCEIEKKVKGKDLEGTVCVHPFVKRDSIVVLANYVSFEEGTGCVHTAPGHGQEDYLTGKKYKLPIIMPVNSKGEFDESCGEFSGLKVSESNGKIIDRLKKNDSLLLSENIDHSYPHCWRCKKPIIFRATEQYFCGVDHKNLRKKILDIIKSKVGWYPNTGEARITSMMENRPDWCLSRQRHWGVPIVAFKCAKCEEVLLDDKVINYVAEIFEKEGSDAWFIKSEKDLMPKETKCKKCKSSDFVKEKDIVDVWFESGVSHQAVLKNNYRLGLPCKLYLEGSDQHRGWFQSSLITSCAIEDKAPYENVFTHGFVVDGEGKKMSKSLGNVISPQDVMKKDGADILRLWVASSNYHDDVRLSDEILKRVPDAYRKIRNTFKYILGNIADFDPKKHAVDIKKMTEIDRWMLSKLAGIISNSEKCYSEFAFYKVFRYVYTFCVTDISNLYLDILKDRLYTFGENSLERRSCQTVLYEILVALLKILAPILTFTTEEAWQVLNPEGESIHLSLWQWDKELLNSWKDTKLEVKWERLIEVREVVLKSLEEKRANNEIGSSLEAKVVIKTKNEALKKLLTENIALLPMFFITSQVEISETGCEKLEKEFGVFIDKAEGAKCSRCWNYSKTVGNDKKFSDICSRCAGVVNDIQDKKEES